MAKIEKMNIRVISILCPKCGAGVRFHEEDRIIKCLHCGMDFIPVHSDGVERYYFEPRVDNFQTKLKNFLKNKGFKKTNYNIVDVDNFFIPVWKGASQVTGWVSGLSPIKTIVYTEMVTGPNGRQIPVKRKRKKGGIPLKKLIKIEKEILYNAVKFPDIRWRIEEVNKDEYSTSVKVYNEEEMTKWGKILTPDVSPQIEKKDVKTRFIQSSIALYIDYEPFRHRLKVIGQRVFLYYFPVTLLKVKLHNQLIFLTVNRLSGKVTSNTLVRKESVPKRKMTLSLDTILIFLSSFIATSLIHTNNSITSQIGIIIPLVTILYIWLKR